MRIRISMLAAACGTLLFLLNGCFWNVHQTPQPKPEPPSPVLQFMIANAPGAMTMLSDPEFGGEVRITLEESFMSAGGENCKRATVVSTDQDPEIIVACQDKTSSTEMDNIWRLVPRVWGRNR